MIPVTYRNIRVSAPEKSNNKADNQLVVVYNARVDSLLNELTQSAKNLTITNITADWMLFMDDLNSKMFDKISF